MESLTINVKLLKVNADLFQGVYICINEYMYLKAMSVSQTFNIVLRTFLSLNRLQPKNLGTNEEH